MGQGNDGGGAARTDYSPEEPERAPDPFGSAAVPKPFSAIAEGVVGLVGSTVAEIEGILSPEEARRRELASVMKGRGMGRER